MRTAPRFRFFPVVIRDYWTSELLSRDICVKEALAVLFVLQALPESIWHRRVDVLVDNEGLALAWSGLRSSSEGLIGVLRELFLLCLDFNVELCLHWVPSEANLADAPSRALSRADARLSVRLRSRLWSLWGPFAFDLMALPSNVFCCDGISLPFFAPHPVLGCSGVDVFSQSPPGGVLYVFPPFVMVSALIGLLAEWGDVCAVLVLPFESSSSAPAWFHRLSPFVLEALPLSERSDTDVVCFPSSSGFVPNSRPLRSGLTAFRCFFPPRAAISAPLPPPSLPVLVVSDSMLRPLSGLVWPLPLDVEVVCLSGARLEKVVSSLASHLSRGRFVAALFHGGINDVSCSPVDFDALFAQSCAFALSRLSSFSGIRFFCSSVCQTRSSALNIRVRAANDALRDVSARAGWSFVSNDNIFYSDLSDDVHLAASGVAKIYRRLSTALRVILPVNSV